MPSRPTPYYSLAELLLQRERTIDLLEDISLGGPPGFFTVDTLQTRLAAIEKEIGIAADLQADEFERQHSAGNRPFDWEVD